MNRLKNLRLETYILIVLPLVRILSLVAADPLLFLKYGRGILVGALFYLFLGGNFLVIAFTFLYIYFAARILWAIKRYIDAKFDKTKPPKVHPWRVLKSAAYFLAIIGLPAFATAVEVGNLWNVSTERVAQGSAFLMNLDHRVFGFFPSFINIFQPASVLSEQFSVFIIMTYLSLGILLSIFFLALMIGKTELFRKYILVFFITTAIGFPIWYSIPAVSPHFMYRYNIFDATISPDVAREIDAHQYDRVLGGYIDYANQTIKNNLDVSEAPLRRTFYPFTTFPSMHGAWGVMIAYFATKLWAPLGIIMIPWVLLNAFSGVYMQWHYAVDMLLGFLVAGLAIWIVNKLLEREKRLGKDKREYILVVRMIQHDARAVFRFIKQHAKKALVYVRRRP